SICRPDQRTRRIHPVPHIRLPLHRLLRLIADVCPDLHRPRRPRRRLEPQRIRKRRRGEALYIRKRQQIDIVQIADPTQ
ncbi:hypothetical protein, partial [Mycobacteroides abscessus]|uniref:hypothetical protein n=1 Tax=Mycobacteroides abscessus TaxID=36809 RepID=UPI001A984819